MSSCQKFGLHCNFLLVRFIRVTVNTATRVVVLHHKVPKGYQFQGGTVADLGDPNNEHLKPGPAL